MLLVIGRDTMNGLPVSKGCSVVGRCNCALSKENWLQANIYANNVQELSEKHSPFPMDSTTSKTSAVRSPKKGCHQSLSNFKILIFSKYFKNYVTSLVYTLNPQLRIQLFSSA